MTSRRSDGWESLDADALSDLAEKEFEDFCYDLVAFEAYDRHEEPRLGGPTPDGKDGGRDILLVVTRQPRESRSEYQRRHKLRPLTHDLIKRTAYSCKTGPGWLNLALDDAQARGARAIEVLLEGGRFTLLISAVGKLDERYLRGGIKQTPHEHLVAALWERMKQQDPAAPDPSDRVEILDANDLALFLRARRPADGDLARWMRRLELRPLLQGLEDWGASHRVDREDLPYVDEGARAAILEGVIAFARARPADATQRVGWLLGPPGVGKTRLVLEAMRRDPSVSQRVRVAITAVEASASLDDVLDRYPSVLLVVDDCPAEGARDLARSFRVRTRDRSDCHLLVMTPAALTERDRADIATRWELSPLSDDAARQIVAGALPEEAAFEAATVERIVRLAEGFPWFIALLAREAASEGRPPDNMREAVEWALASKWEASGQALHDLRRDRMRAMLAVLLAHDVDWSELSVAQQDAVARAVGLSRWDEVRALANDCVKRGVLRRRLHFQYVTPEVLAREIATNLFDPDGGDDPGGRRVQAHGGALLNGFFEEINRLGVRLDVARELGRTVLERIRSAGAAWDALQASPVLGAPLSFAAMHLPTETAGVLRTIIEGASIEALRSDVVARRPVMFVLEELASRRGAFEDAEASLFRLGLAENESYANNATATWALLFSPVLHMTYEGSKERVALVHERLVSSDPAERRLALKGARAMLAVEESRGAPRQFDGAWLRPTDDEARSVRLCAWKEVLARLEDVDPAVVDDAAAIVRDELTTAVWAGLGDAVVPMLAARAARLSEQHRRGLGDALHKMRTFSADGSAFESAAMRELEQALEPTTFAQLLRQRIGTWAADLEDSPEINDDALAGQSLANMPALLAELGWLSSPDAVRSPAFACALGRCDRGGRLLAVLRARCARSEPGATPFFARYLSGVQTAGRADLVDSELRVARGSQYGDLLLAQVSVLTSATAERLASIEDAVREGEASRAVLVTVGHHGRWLRGLSDDRVYSFLDSLLEWGGVEGASAALRIVQDRLGLGEGAAARFRDVTMRALERCARETVSPTIDHAWTVCAGAMIELGEVGAIADLTVQALGRPSGSLREAWRVLERAHARDAIATWEAVARGVDRRDAIGGHLVLAFRFHRRGFAWPSEHVLEWVGRDARRARAAVQLVMFEGDALPPVYRVLIERFGATSSVANEIAATIQSTRGLVASLAAHDRERLEAAKRWLDDESPEVKAFAERVVATLSRSFELHDAEEAEERRRWGT